MQRFAWRRGFEKLRDRLCKLLDFASVNRFDHRLSAREMAIKCADSHAGAARDFLQAHGESDIRERRFGRVDQQLPIPGAVGTRLARLRRWLAFHL
jgi:hypothetical protein